MTRQRLGMIAGAAVAIAVAGHVAIAAAVGRPQQSQDVRVREFSVTARKYAYEPAIIEVDENDLVRVTMKTEDIPHSFVSDEYRIAKRAAPDRPTTFEFRADQAGTFKFYCNLKIDDGCREMHGELTVRGR